jgi:hypothetical protein
MLESDEDWRRCVHGYEDRSPEVCCMYGVDRVAKAEVAGYVHGHGSVRKGQVCCPVFFFQPCKDLGKVVDLCH